MSDSEVHALLEAHDYIGREIGSATPAEDEFQDGHVNGLKEARNRVEQAILDRVE